MTPLFFSPPTEKIIFNAWKSNYLSWKLNYLPWIFYSYNFGDVFLYRTHVSYTDFTTALQRETRDVLRERAAKATVTYFTGKQIKIGEEVHTISETEASRIIIYLEDNGYIDYQKNITPELLLSGKRV